MPNAYMMDGWVEGWMNGWMDAGMDGWMGGGMDGWMGGGMDRFQEKRNKFPYFTPWFLWQLQKDKSEHTFLINSKWMHAEYITEDAFTLAIPHIYESIVWDQINKPNA